MNILHIETSTRVCSIALSENSQCLFTRSDFEGMKHASLLSIFIEDAFKFLKEKNKKLDAVTVGRGPGSYTGLRIGASTAKGLCYGLDIPLISISTLETLMLAAKKEITSESKNHMFIPMIDARRMEVYDAIYDQNGSLVREIKAKIIDKHSYQAELKNFKVFFFGDGADKCKSVITHPNAVFLDNIHPLAENMIEKTFQKFQNQKFEDIAYFEPFYLKEFQATTPKKLLNVER